MSDTNIRRENGQSAVEFALVLPVLLLIIIGIINFGWIFGNTIIAGNACREAARDLAVHYTDDVAYQADPQSKARATVDNYAPVLISQLPDTSPQVTISGESITVALNVNIRILTPLPDFVAGFGSSYDSATNSFAYRSECTMRIE